MTELIDFLKTVFGVKTPAEKIEIVAISEQFLIEANGLGQGTGNIAGTIINGLSYPNQIVLSVDNAKMVSAEDLKSMLEKAEKLDSEMY